MPVKRWHLEAAAVIAALVVAAVMASQMPGFRGLMLADGMPLFGDYIAFWSGGRLALEGNVAQLHNEAAILAAHHEAIPELTHIFPWRSPPIFLLLMAPLAALPFWISASVFLALSFAIYAYGVARLGRDPRILIFALAAPAALFHIGSSQLGVMIAGLSALALHWLERRPIAAGAAIAAMAIKPHLALLWPIYLAVIGRWRTFLAAAAFVIMLGLLAGVLFGFGAYERFFADIGVAQSFVTERRLPANVLASVYASLIYLHVPAEIALGAHAASAAAALAACVTIWRRGDTVAGAVALCAATLLISPYLFFYDTLLLIVAIAALASRPMSRAEIAVSGFAFLAPALSLLIGLRVNLPICPLAAWGLLAVVVRPARASVAAAAS